MPTYRHQVASDLARDGMALEVWNDDDELIAEVFYSDVQQSFTLTTFNRPVDMTLIEEALSQAKRRLPPSR